MLYFLKFFSDHLCICYKDNDKKLFQYIEQILSAALDITVVSSAGIICVYPDLFLLVQKILLAILAYSLEF